MSIRLSPSHFNSNLTPGFSTQLLQAENRSYSSYYTSYTDTIVTVIIGWHPRQQVHGGRFGAPRRELHHLPQAKGEVR